MSDERNRREYFPNGGRQGETPSHLVIREISYAGLRIACIKDFYQGHLTALSTFDSIIVEYSDPAFSTLLISRIRAHFDHLLFIKPVFILKEFGTLVGALAEAADGSINDLHNLSHLETTSRKILNKISKIDLSKDQTYEELVIFNFLAFLYSRGIEQLRPLVDKAGIYYPVLSDVMRQNVHQKHFLLVLEKMEKEAYVQSFFDRATYVCSECMADYLMYREVCPHCHSAHLKSEEVIHHFRCAHVAPMSDFKAGVDDGLECPKCQHHLKHIGVDYDKPATMHYCQECNSSFQNYAMKAYCCSCGHDQEVEHLIKKELRKYSLTDKAINALQSGKLYSRDIPREAVLEDTLPWHLFVKTVDFEETQNSSGKSHIVVLHFQDLNSIIKQIGEGNRQKIFNEIIQIIKVTQQPFDFRGVKFPRLYFSLLQTRQSEAEIISQRIVFLINHLLSDNLRLKRVLLTAEVLPMDGKLVQTILSEIPSIT